MGRMKDKWLDIFEDLSDELGREPSDDEINQRFAEICSAMHDDHIDR